MPSEQDTQMNFDATSWDSKPMLNLGFRVPPCIYSQVALPPKLGEPGGKNDTEYFLVLNESSV